VTLFPYSSGRVIVGEPFGRENGPVQPPLQNPYDEVPYDGGTHPKTHPQHIAMMARLFGLSTAKAESCRVLELGCSIGTNLLPMAYALPGSSFIGIDLAAGQIAIAQQRAESLSLSNIEFHHAAIGDVLAWDGEYDYIICHGVFSWVSAGVKEQILQVMQKLLAPNGVGFISYNAQPGWHMRGAVREMMKFHAASFGDLTERAGQARALLEFVAGAAGELAEGGRPLQGIYHKMLAYEAKSLAGFPDYYVVHEHLETVNTPLYFHEFTGMLPPHELQYLGDAEFSSMVSSTLPGDVAAKLDEITSEHLAFEQYRDFVVNRQFRQSMVCRAGVPLSRQVVPDRFRDLAFRKSYVQWADGVPSTIRAGGAAAEVRSPVARAVLQRLTDCYPAASDVGDLMEAVPADGWPAEVANRDEHLLAVLLTLFASDAVEFRTWSPPLGVEQTEVPRSYVPARLERAVALGIPNAFHQTIHVSKAAQALLPLMDGTRTRDELAAWLAARPVGESEDEPEEPRSIVDKVISELYSQALLER